jgi:hypothetical protein
MAELATIARPYAEASFRSALEKQDLAGWSDGLALAGAIAADPQMADLLGNPRLTRAGKLEVFSSSRPRGPNCCPRSPRSSTRSSAPTRASSRCAS